MSATRRLVIFTVAAVLLMLLLSFPALLELATDWYWFDSVGYRALFVKSLTTRLAVGSMFGIVSALFFFANFRFAQRGVVPDSVLVNLSPRLQQVDITGFLRGLSLPIALFLGFLVGVAGSELWLPTLEFLHRIDFGVSDPVFGREVAYYVFTLPIVEAALDVITTLTALALVFVIPIYVLRRDVIIRSGRLSIEPSAERHIGALVVVLFLVAAADAFFVKIPELMFSTTGPLYGASYTDLRVTAPALRVVGVLALVAAGFVVLGARRHRVAFNALIGGALFLVGYLLLGALLPAAVQRFIVAPNELVKEGPQLEHHIAATRKAWNLDSVGVRDITGEESLSLQDIRDNAGTIRNVRLWDREPLLQTFGQLQEIRTYYDFITVDDDRYWIDGQYRQVLLSPRELNPASLPTRTFINEHLTYTHGMGLTLSPVNQVTEEGLPVLFIKDLPPESEVSLNVTRPEIYYGELTNNYVFVNTDQPEFNFPSDEGNEFTNYEGEGGVVVNSIFRRALLSLRFGALKVLLSNDINNDSRALFHRNIENRVQRIFPFLALDSDPYIVITDDGELKWILDAYTATNRYPYSQPLGDGTNYIRNSVKVVVDAYDGSVVPYIAEPDDPIIQAYDAAFPGAFLPIDSMPADLRAHVRYPEDIFRVQTQLYTTYHMDEPENFYHREDQWQIPVVQRGEGSRDPFLRHIVMKLPGVEQEEFILMTPFTPRQKDNLAAWMVARNDGEHYGELVVYRFPRQSLVFGPTQIINRINQNTEISRQFSLWDQRGSQVIRGNLLVIPIKEALIFVQAIYLRAEGGRIPELKRVVVAYQNQVVMEETLSEGLRLLFGGRVEEDGAPEADVPVTTTRTGEAPAPGEELEDLIRRASEAYDAALEAQRRGDWSTYGQQIEEAGRLLRQLRGLAEGS